MGEQGFEKVDPEDRDTITMSVTMDVSDMDDRDKEILSVIADIYEDNFQEIVNKNRDYGFSFLITGQKLTNSPGSPFDNVTRSQAYGLLTRCGDKRERLIENIYGDGDAAVSDEPHVTAREAANYYLFLSFVLEHPELAVLGE